MQTLEPILVKHPFVKGLEPQYIKLLVGCASNVRFSTGHYLFREGEEANRFYMIRQGKVAVEIRASKRASIIVQTVGEGEVLGWSWLIPPYRSRFDARAVEHTRAIALDGKCLRRKSEEDHNLGYELLRRFSGIVVERLDATRLQLLDVYGNPSLRSKRWKTNRVPIPPQSRSGFLRRHECPPSGRNLEDS